MPDYNFYLKIDSPVIADFTDGSDNLLFSGDWLETYPGTGRDVGLKYSVENNRTRITFDGELTFLNRMVSDVLKSDFDTLYNIVSPSTEVELRIQQVCNETTTSDWWLGYFSIIDGAWDSDAATVKIKPSPNDAYRSLSELGDKEYNLYTLNPSSAVSVQETSASDLIFSTCYAGTRFEWESDYDPDGTYVAGAGPSDEWDIWTWVDSLTEAAQTYEGVDYWDCVPGSGNKIHVWRRERVTFDPGDGTWLDEGLDVYGNSYGYYAKTRPSATATQTVTRAFGNSRWAYLKDIITHIVDDIDSFTYKSTFLENDTVVGGGSGGTSNYVTLTDPNPLKNMLVTQKSNIKTTTNPATKWLMSFNQLMEWLKYTFNVDWFVDADENFRIEHYSYFTKVADTDLLTLDNGKWINKKNKWSYDVPVMPNREHFEFAESSGVDFIGTDIIYDRLATGNRFKDNQKDYITPITTDVAFMINEPSKISDEGWVLVTNDGTYIRNVVGILSGANNVNADLSWANLHNNYWKHGRVLSVGTMNNVNTNFSDWQKTIKQEEVTYRQCCSDFSAEGLKTTELGDGEIREAKYKMIDGTVTTVFFYPNVKAPSPPPAESYIIKISNSEYLLYDGTEVIIWKT